MSKQSSFTELTALGIMTPAQWYAGVGGDDPRFQGTKQLMLAVLADALKCIQNSTASDNIVKRRKLAEVESWIGDRDAQEPFSFRND